MSFTSFPPFFLSFSLSLAPMGASPTPTFKSFCEFHELHGLREAVAW